jgi:hypothetical protein
MFVVYNKDKWRSQDNQDKEVQTKYKERTNKKKNPARGLDVYIVCKEKGKSQDNEDRETIMKKVQKREQKRASRKNNPRRVKRIPPA